MVRHFALLYGLALPLSACAQDALQSCLNDVAAVSDGVSGPVVVSDTTELDRWRVGVSGRSVGLTTDTDALRASFGDPDSVRFVSGGPDRDGYRHRSWVYPFGSFSVFADSSAALDWFDVAVAGGSVVTSEGEFDADTRLDELGQTYPRSWKCRAVHLGHGSYMANDPPQESIAVYDVSDLDAHVKERRPITASVRFVGRDGRLAFIEVGG